MNQSEQVLWFVTKAVDGYGERVLARDDELGAAGPQAVGCELARLIFGRTEAGAMIPVPLVEMVEHPGSERAWTAVDVHVENVLESNPGLAAAVAEVLAGHYRQLLESGDGQALAELGDLLWFDDPQLAQTAFERAIEAGNKRALIRLAEHRWVMIRIGSELAPSAPRDRMSRQL
jgi:hypothetical protein